MNPKTGLDWAAVAVLLFSAVFCARVWAVPASAVDYVGSKQCAECHETEFALWRRSHHDLAMAEASDETVLGDFDDATFTAHGVTSTFYRKDGGFFVRTDGADGELDDFRIKYSFGWVPLQQYLIEFPRGHFQSLGIAWDSRPRDEGGQRWFHLYPDEAMDHESPLHWTSRDQMWNYQCAECHSTNLHKGYDLSTDSFETTWAEIDVACEACHGPGSGHLEQALAVQGGDTQAWDDGKGLVVDLADSDGGLWSIDAETGTPRRSVPRENRNKIELCARCHSRRSQISDRYLHGAPLGETHRLALLDEHLYYPDGQIKDEVYVHGSFIQSRMYAAGVTCTDCHDPHSLRLKTDGDLVCAQCHEVGRYDVAAHHHHPEDAAGVGCISCHMPQRAYMVIDDRADHSMRVPSPELSLRLGTPNACNACHKDKSVQWSAEAVRQWYGEEPNQRPHYGEALHAGRTGAAGAGKRLLALASDRSQPGIARATALELLRGFAAASDLFSVQRLLGDSDPLVRAAAVGYLETVDPQAALRLAGPLLDDPILAVRLEAVRILAPWLHPERSSELPQEVRESLESALRTYRASQLVIAERAEAHLNIALIEFARGDDSAAEQSYRTGLRLDPKFAPAYANLADLHRVRGEEAEAERVLREGLEADPESAALHHALGLLMVRERRLDDALGELQRAAALAPDEARFAYVYAVALHSAGQTTTALETLEAAHQRHSGNRDLLLMLVALSKEQGDPAAAERYLKVLLQHHPEDLEARQMRDQPLKP